MPLITDKEAIKQLDGGTFAPTLDPLLDALAEAAHGFMVSYLGYDPIVSQYNEVRDGNGNPQIALDVPNVTVIDSLRVDDKLLTPASETYKYGYVFSRDGIVSLRSGRFTRGFQNVAISFTAGLTDYPGDLVMAATELALFKYKVRANIGIQSKSLAQETITFSDKDMPSSVRSAFNDYRRMYLS